MTSFDYRAWVVWTDAFSEGRDDSMDHLCAMHAEIGVVTANRLGQRLADAVHARHALWLEQLTRDMSLARDPHSVENTLVSARRRLTPIHRLCTSPLLLPELSQALTSAVKGALTRVQEHLEAEASRTSRSQGETLLRIYRRNSFAEAFTRIAAATAEDATTTAMTTSAPRSSGSAPRRRLILDTQPGGESNA